MTATDTGYSGNAVQGAQYDADRYITAAEIAKNVRAQIKVAQRAGDLPTTQDGYKFRVRSQSYAGGQSISINIVGPVIDGNDTAFAMRPVDPARQEDAAAESYGLTHVYTDEALRVARLVESFAKAFTREDVDSQSDYFNVSCYVSVYVGQGGRCI